MTPGMSPAALRAALAGSLVVLLAVGLIWAVFAA